MKYITILLFVALAAAGAAQDTTSIVYELDTLRFAGASRDSFFLKITATTKLASKKRPDVKIEEILFQDTSELTGYIRALRGRFADLELQKAQIDVEYNKTDRHVKDLEYLRDSVFTGYTGGPRAMLAPPPEPEGNYAPAWLVMTTPDKVKPWRPGMPVSGPAVILNPDGTIVQIPAPKKKKKK